MSAPAYSEVYEYSIELFDAVPSFDHNATIASSRGVYTVKVALLEWFKLDAVQAFVLANFPGNEWQIEKSSPQTVDNGVDYVSLTIRGRKRAAP